MASEALHIPKGVHARVSIDDLEGQGKLKGMGTKNAEQAAAWLAPEFAGPDGQPAVSKIKFELDEEGSATSVQMLVLLVGLAVFSLREGLVAKFGHSGRVRSGVLKAVMNSAARARRGCWFCQAVAIFWAAIDAGLLPANLALDGMHLVLQGLVLSTEAAAKAQRGGQLHQDTLGLLTLFRALFRFDLSAASIGERVGTGRGTPVFKPHGSGSGYEAAWVAEPGFGLLFAKAVLAKGGKGRAPLHAHALCQEGLQCFLAVLNVRLADPTKPLAAWGTTIEINTAALIPAAAMADAYLCRVAAGTSSSVMPRAVGDAGGEQGAGGKEEEEGSVLAEATLQAGSEGEQVVGGGGGAQQQPAAPGAGGGGGGHEPGSSSGVQGLLEQLCPLHLEEWSTRHFGGGSSSDSPAVKAQQFKQVLLKAATALLKKRWGVRQADHEAFVAAPLAELLERAPKLKALQREEEEEGAAPSTGASAGNQIPEGLQDQIDLVLPMLCWDYVDWSDTDIPEIVDVLESLNFFIGPLELMYGMAMVPASTGTSYPVYWGLCSARLNFAAQLKACVGMHPIRDHSRAAAPVEPGTPCAFPGCTKVSIAGKSGFTRVPEAGDAAVCGACRKHYKRTGTHKPVGEELKGTRARAIPKGTPCGNSMCRVPRLSMDHQYKHVECGEEGKLMLCVPCATYYRDHRTHRPEHLVRAMANKRAAEAPAEPEARPREKGKRASKPPKRD